MVDCRTNVTVDPGPQVCMVCNKRGLHTWSEIHRGYMCYFCLLDAQRIARKAEE